LTVAESVRDWFDDPGNLELCQRLEAAGVRTKIEKISEPATRNFGRQTICLDRQLAASLVMKPGRR